MSIRFPAAVCRSYSRQIPAAFADTPRDAVRAAMTTDAIGQELARHLRDCSDCSNDVLWYAAIREELDVNAYPCIHIAYACSRAANQVIDEQHGMYAIRTDAARGEGIVIGFCPWCGLELNVSALA